MIEENIADLKNKLIHGNVTLKKINIEIAQLENKRYAAHLKVTIEGDTTDGRKDKDQIKQC